MLVFRRSLKGLATTRFETLNTRCYSNEPEFQQVVKEMRICLEGSKVKHAVPDYERILTNISIPNHASQFKVNWEDDRGDLQVNTGYRVQFNNALGPYKGGIRFHPSVNLSIMKFLGFEQVFKNALTGQNMGGAKGGADFDPKGKSDAEIRRFCSSFMKSLYPHIGQFKDVPAGDIGVGSREIGYLFGEYKSLRGEWEGGVISGKGLSYGGSLMRNEATGYGLIYYVTKMIDFISNGQDSIEGKNILISGSGNVAQHAMEKALELNARVLSLSDSQGTIYNPDGISRDVLDLVKIGKLQRKSLIQILEDCAYGDELRSGTVYYQGLKPWEIPVDDIHSVDIALPCATQNEIGASHVMRLAALGCYILAEGSNMSCRLDAVEQLMSHGEKIWYCPGKASNGGGVAVSGLEMAQNSQRVQWSRDVVDAELYRIISDSFESCIDTADEYATGDSHSRLPSLILGANISGFLKVVNAMKEQGELY